MSKALLDEVSDVLRELAEAIVLPRFRRLSAADIQEKSPGDVVTVVDREMERALGSRLEAILPGSACVGEEACAADPSLVEGLKTGRMWVIDPIDGTVNFAAGSEDFAVMVGLLQEGRPIAGWILAPVSGRLAVAEAGSGAFLDGARIRTLPTDPASAAKAGVMGRLVPESIRAAALAGPDAPRLSPGSGAAGIEYPALVEGAWRFLLYWRTFPWDHVPGTLFLTEAGGHAARLDGSPYLPWETDSGLLAAPTPEEWVAARACLPAEVRPAGRAAYPAPRSSG